MCDRQQQPGSSHTDKSYDSKCSLALAVANEFEFGSFFSTNLNFQSLCAVSVHLSRCLLLFRSTVTVGLMQRAVVAYFSHERTERSVA